MTQKAILFIPDISGFTEFVYHTAIKHSRHIISELLELLIDNNIMGMQLAEIEGDALFFYKLEDNVDIKNIEQQIEAMYVAFHTHIKRYEYQRICHCGACSSAHNLKIKFVVHYGDIDFITVKHVRKPHGSPVIEAHRLLKNKVPDKEYAIFTKSVKSINAENDQAEMTETYDFGTITYTYNLLSHLKTSLPQINLIPDDVPRHRLYCETEVLKIKPEELYEVISNFDYRLLWNRGINRVDYIRNRVNRVGDKHKCLINHKEVEQITVTKTVEKNQLVYGESTTEAPFLKRLSIYFILEQTENENTELQVEVFADFNILGIFLKPLMKRSLKRNISKNFEELIYLIDSGFTIKY